MSNQQPEWNDITGNAGEQARKKVRARYREERHRTWLLLLTGFTLILGGIVLGGLGVIASPWGMRSDFLFGGALVAGLGVLVIAFCFQTVYRVQQHGRGRITITSHLDYVDGERQALENELDRRADQGFEVFLDQNDPRQGPAIKIRCRSCQGLNDEQANDCAACGANLR